MLYFFQRVCYLWPFRMNSIFTNNKHQSSFFQNLCDYSYARSGGRLTTHFHTPCGDDTSREIQKNKGTDAAEHAFEPKILADI